MAEEITSIMEAFDAAKADLQAPPVPDLSVSTDDPIETPPVVDDDETEASDLELQALIDEIDVAPLDPESTPDVSSDAFWSTVVELEEGMPVPLSDLRDGFLRQSDYTKKTQVLAEQRKRLEQAEAFYQSYVDDPGEFSRTVAVENGWLTGDQRTPVREVTGAKLPSTDELDQRLDELVTERLQNSEEYTQMRQAEANQTIDNKFAEIEKGLKVTLPVSVRQEIIAEAQRRNVFDLELITGHWLSKQRERRRSGEQLKQGASARPQSAGATASDGTPLEVETFADAVLAAKAELSAGA